MDVSTIKPIERVVEIINPGTNQPVGIRVRVVSIEDERLKRLKRTITDERLKQDSKNKAPKSEEIERNSHMLLFTASLGWEWYNPTGKQGDEGYDPEAMPDWKGEVPDYNQRNFIEIVSEWPPFGNQISEAMDDTKAFFDNSKRS